MSEQLPAVIGGETGAGALPAIPGPEDVLTSWLAGRNPQTLLAYAADLKDFAKFLGVRSGPSAVDLLMAGGHGQANRIAMAYRAQMVERRLASATVSRRLAALRSMVKVARQIGRITWALDVESPRIESYRDTRGPGLEGWRRIVAAVRARALQGEWAALRDLAIVRLLHDLGLRREEAAQLDVEDLELEDTPGTVAIVGKGKTDKIRLTLNLPTRSALRDWIAARGDDPGAVFPRLDRAAEGPDRLSGEALERIVKRWARRAGINSVVRPHGLRHQGITRALDLSGGDVRKVQRFSRHAKLETLMRYDDARRDDAGDIARQLGEDGDS